ncbi:hypothetical protein C8R44DRAFT_875321 [Mycena epipterygia]|nr:hypothetical protein C8R44DRAFT_875321 [Mycena epipterygia]
MAVKNLTPANPLQYDLTLLQNPCLPAETLPVTYKFEAYDRAILCPLALQDRMKKGVFNSCDSCKIPWEHGQQPPDALANFQYYTRAELPPGVRIAFETASMYDIMMVARARTTRITHLFSEKTKKEQPDEFTAVSQRYSKGNVAIFGHNVVSLRTILLPPKQEIHEVMCTLFIGLSVALTRKKT